MTVNPEMRPPTEYVGVVKLVNSYIPIHVTTAEKRFISRHPEEDLRVAQATAQAFAKAKQLVYTDHFFELNKPIITIVKHQENWFPAGLYPDRIRLFESYGSKVNLGGSQEVATNTARVIALSMSTDCILSIGISLSEGLVAEGKT